MALAPLSRVGSNIPGTDAFIRLGRKFEEPIALPGSSSSSLSRRDPDALQRDLLIVIRPSNPTDTRS